MGTTDLDGRWYGRSVRTRYTWCDGGNGRAVPALAPDQSIGDLFRQLTTDSSHLVRQEINLAKTELKETGSRLGQAGAARQ